MEGEAIRTSFFGLRLCGIRHCVSSQTQPHDVVWANTWLKRWAEGRKGEDDMTVNQELDLDGRAENGRNLGRSIPQTHLLFSKISQYRSPDTRGLYITIYRTRQQDGRQAPGAGSRPPASGP